MIRSRLVEWRRLGLVVALAMTTLGVQFALAPASHAQLYRYTIETRGDVEGEQSTFAVYSRDTLGDIRGWTLNFNVSYERIATGGNFDFRLILASPEEVDNASPACSAEWSCQVGNQVLINDERWRNTTPTWPLSRSAYRHYVINHEVGHWLGLGHFDCPGAGEPAPVMMQQSMGLEGCEARVWPLFWERAEVARIHGVDHWPTPPRDAPCTIEGGGDGEVLEGTGHADVICGGDGDDELIGRGGHDLLRGGGGDDVLRAGPGRDLVLAARGDDRINGATGNDELRGGPGDDYVSGRRGADVIFGGGGRDELRGGPGADSIRGNSGADLLLGGGGEDALIGGRGPDELDGGPDDDVLRGSRASDRLMGRRGDDRIFGGFQDDVLGGHGGDDLLDGGRGTDRCNPGRGDNRLRNCDEVVGG